MFKAKANFKANKKYFLKDQVITDEQASELNVATLIKDDLLAELDLLPTPELEDLNESSDPKEDEEPEDLQEEPEEEPKKKKKKGK